MATPTVREQPRMRDFFTLDGERSPGRAKISSGGEDKEDIQDVGQALTKGKNTIVRSSENPVITYELFMWEIGHLQTWDRWEKMLLEGKARTPNPRVYTFRDLRARWIQRVIYQSMAPEKRMHTSIPNSKYTNTSGPTKQSKSHSVISLLLCTRNRHTDTM